MSASSSGEKAKSNIITIAVVSDIRLGLHYGDHIRGIDSSLALEESLKLCQSYPADVLLICGNLFCGGAMSTALVRSTLSVFHRMVSGRRATCFETYGHPSIPFSRVLCGATLPNWCEKDIKVSIPVITVAGSLDRPSVSTDPDVRVSPLDVLTAARFANRIDGETVSGGDGERRGDGVSAGDGETVSGGDANVAATSSGGSAPLAFRLTPIVVARESTLVALYGLRYHTPAELQDATFELVPPPGYPETRYFRILVTAIAPVQGSQGQGQKGQKSSFKDARANAHVRILKASFPTVDLLVVGGLPAFFDDEGNEEIPFVVGPGPALAHTRRDGQRGSLGFLSVRGPNWRFEEHALTHSRPHAVVTLNRSDFLSSGDVVNCSDSEGDAPMPGFGGNPNGCHTAEDAKQLIVQKTRDAIRIAQESSKLPKEIIAAHPNIRLPCVDARVNVPFAVSAAAIAREFAGAVANPLDFLTIRRVRRQEPRVGTEHGGPHNQALGGDGDGDYEDAPALAMDPEAAIGKMYTERVGASASTCLSPELVLGLVDEGAAALEHNLAAALADTGKWLAAELGLGPRAQPKGAYEEIAAATDHTAAVDIVSQILRARRSHANPQVKKAEKAAAEPDSDGSDSSSSADTTSNTASSEGPPAKRGRGSRGGRAGRAAAPKAAAKAAAKAAPKAPAPKSKRASAARGRRGRGATVSNADNPFTRAAASPIMDAAPPSAIADDPESESDEDGIFSAYAAKEGRR